MSSRLPVPKEDDSNDPYGDGRRWLHHEKGPQHSFYSSMDINRTNVNGVYAFHPRGAHVVMCDGSVHFELEGTHPEIMVAFFSRDGGVEEKLRLSRLDDQTPK